MTDKIKIALAGNPNAGKTTLFNCLTGSRQHVGNYPGVTVEKKEGIHVYENRQINIVDLPGTYSLTAYSVEEVVARDFLVNENPEVVINITDAANLERNLYLSTQFLELGIPMIIALNMIDLARDRGIDIRTEKLAELLGVQVIPIIARSGEGTGKLMAAAIRLAEQNQQWQPVNISYGDDLDTVLLEMDHKIKEASFLTQTYPSRWIGIKYLEADPQVMAKGTLENPQLAAELSGMVDTVANHLLTTMDTYPDAIIADHRYGYIKSILRQGVISQSYDMNRLYTSDRIDKVVTNRILGPFVMMAVLLGLYKFTFTFSEIPVGWLEIFFNWLAAIVDGNMADSQLKSLLISGIIDGVGGVIGFVPLIMFMFFGIAILEDSGYLARVAFMLDRVFQFFGLHGSSVMAYIISGGIAGGCAVPGVMATRTLRSPRERIATLLTAPFMNCGAKLPVLALLTSVFFAENQTRILFMLTLLTWIIALIIAKLFRSTVLRGASTPFVMELPPYRLPTLKGLLIHTWEKVWQYIRKAGTVILAISIILWTMMTYPQLPQQQRDDFDLQRQQIDAALQTAAGKETNPGLEELATRRAIIDRQQAEQTLQHSWAGRFGKAMEKISWMTGFDWRVNIALLGGFAAKEVVISTLGTAYSLGAIAADEPKNLAQALADDGHWNKAMAMSLIIFVMFYSPCFITVICIVKETGSWKWGIFSILFNTSFAFLLASLVYRIGLAAGWGG